MKIIIEVGRQNPKPKPIKILIIIIEISFKKKIIIICENKIIKGEYFNNNVLFDSIFHAVIEPKEKPKNITEFKRIFSKFDKFNLVFINVDKFE